MDSNIEKLEQILLNLSIVFENIDDVDKSQSFISKIVKDLTEVHEVINALGIKEKMNEYSFD